MDFRLSMPAFGWLDPLCELLKAFKSYLEPV